MTLSRTLRFMLMLMLMLKSYLELDNIYRPFLRRILEGLSERGFFREDKTGLPSRIDGEEIIEYTLTTRLSKNCDKFLKYGTADIDDRSLQLEY